MKENLILNYVVMRNNGVDAFFAEAGFAYKHEAIEYADKKAAGYEPYDPGDGDEAYNSARVAHFEVIRVCGDDWETVYETRSFYND